MLDGPRSIASVDSIIHKGRAPARPISGERVSFIHLTTLFSADRIWSADESRRFSARDRKFASVASQQVIPIDPTCQSSLRFVPHLFFFSLSDDDSCFFYSSPLPCVSSPSDYSARDGYDRAECHEEKHRRENRVVVPKAAPFLVSLGHGQAIYF